MVQIPDTDAARAAAAELCEILKVRAVPENVVIAPDGKVQYLLPQTRKSDAPTRQ